MARREECVKALERVVHQLTWLGRKSLAQELSYYGVTVPQFYALLSLEKRGRACPMSELAQLPAASPARVARWCTNCRGWPEGRSPLLRGGEGLDRETTEGGGNQWTQYGAATATEVARNWTA